MKTLFLLCTVGLLAACAAKEPPPKITYDDVDFRQAAVEPEPPRPVEVVTVPEPLPLPGQLKPVPDHAAKESAKDTSDPRDRVKAAQDAARYEPAAKGYVNAIQVYPFTEGALYRVYAAPSQVSDIALQPGEQLVAVSAGDTVRWVVGDTASGKGSDARVHVLDKPIAPDLATNLVIITERRPHHQELDSPAETHMAAVSWDDHR